jgi:hypothetical protein
MKVIYYRVYNSNNGQMMYSDSRPDRCWHWFSEHDGGKILTNKGFQGEDKVTSDPMLYSEMKDVNSRPIYEQDVCTITYPDKSMMPATVVFVFGCFELHCGNEGTDYLKFFVEGRPWNHAIVEVTGDTFIGTTHIRDFAPKHEPRTG